MSQGVIPIATGGDGATVRSRLNAALQRLQTKGSGTTRPTDIVAYEDWIDTDTPGSGVVTWYIYDGTSDISLGTVNTTTHVWTPASAGSASIPQGRLTLTSATPVLTATVSAATTIYYALYTGNLIPIYSGTAWVMTTFTEISNATAQSSTGSAGPAVVANNLNYDLFAWSNSGTLTLSRGPPWTSDTVRGTGSGTSQISRVLGIWSNTVAITNGPGAGLGTYVGTVRSNGSATIDFIFGGSAAGGTAAVLGLWNAYNRVDAALNIADSNTYWTYAGAGVWRSANASAAMRTSMVRGLNEDGVTGIYNQLGSINGGGSMAVGIGLDSTTAPTGATGYTATTSALAVIANYAGLPGLGFHFLQAIEYSITGTASFNGSNGSNIATGFFVTAKV